MADPSVSVSMTLSDPLPGFQGHCILTSPISENGTSSGRSCRRTLIGNHTQSSEWYRCQRPLHPDFKVALYFDLNMSAKMTPDRAPVTIERQREVVDGLSNGITFDDLE